MRKQIQNNDDVVVNFTSLTCIISNLEGVDVLDVVTSNNVEKMATINIMAQQKTTTIENGTGNRFRVTINLWGFITENASMLLSHPSSPMDWTLPSSQGQSNHLQFENVVNQELAIINVEHKVTLTSAKIITKQEVTMN